MEPNAAVCLVLGGLALLLRGRPPGQRWRKAQLACALVLLVLAVLSLLENISGPALGLVAFASALLLREPTAGRHGESLLQGLALATAACGLLSLAGYFLKLDLVYGWQSFARTAPLVAAGVSVLGTGLWLQARSGSDDRQVRRMGRDILSMVAAALVVVTLAAGVMGFAFMQGRVEQMTTESLSRLHSDRARLFTNIILQNTLLAVSVAALPGTVASMRRLEEAPDDPVARVQLQEITRSYLPSGGSAWVAFYREGRLLAEAGSASPQPEMTVALRGSVKRELLWSQGFHLRTRLAVRDRERVLGEMVMERSLDVLTLLTADANQWGETGELMLCTLDGDPFRCFPGRFLVQPFTVPRAIEGKSTLVAETLKGKPGVIAAPDFRDQQVLAAYGPVGNFGLGMVVKMDRAELYAPVRRQLQIMLLSLALVVALSLWLVHGRLRPLLRQLVESQQAAQANEARFLAAAESSPDAFYILDSVRDGGRNIIDFRVTYVNENGAKLFSSLPTDRLTGQLLCEVVPVIRAGGFFDKYKRVAETGQSLLEEFPVSSPGLTATWLSHQVARLGDGVAITSRDISERKALEERFKYMAQNDALTGLPNRALFLDRLEQATLRARRGKQPMALMFLDVDHFKGVNDTLGHAAGDELLRTFAERLKGCVRRNDTVARLGGDEFTIILEGLHAPQDSEIVARKIAAALRPPIKLAEREVTITSSIGIANYFDAANKELSPGTLLEQADQALYAAKHRGRNGYALYTPDLESQAPQPG